LLHASLREPGVDLLVPGQHPEEGLAQCLAASEANFSEYIVNGAPKSLSVMYSGGAAPNPQELLAGERFKALADFSLRDYEFTIIDTPPANSCADARRVGSVIGYALIVARRHETFVDDVKTLAAELRADHTRVIGSVLNEV